MEKPAPLKSRTSTPRGKRRPGRPRPNKGPARPTALPRTYPYPNRRPPFVRPCLDGLVVRGLLQTNQISQEGPVKADDQVHYER